MYEVYDLMDKFIKIEEFGYDYYMKLSENEEIDDNLKLLARVFAKQEKRHIDIYKKLKEQNESFRNIAIDFFIYDKASQLVYQFYKMHENDVPKSLNEMIKTALEFEKDNLALVLRIRGYFVEKQEHINSEVYKIMDRVVEEEKKHIKDIEVYAGKNKI